MGAAGGISGEDRHALLFEHRLEGADEGKKTESSSEAVTWQSYEQEILVAWTKVTRVENERSSRMLRV